MKTGLKMFTLESRASSVTPTMSSVMNTTLVTAVLTTADPVTTHWATTPATKRATATVWTAGREITALNVSEKTSFLLALALLFV